MMDARFADVLMPELKRSEIRGKAEKAGDYADRLRSRARTGAHSSGWEATCRNGSTGTIQPELPAGAAASAA